MNKYYLVLFRTFKKYCKFYLVSDVVCDYRREKWHNRNWYKCSSKTCPVFKRLSKLEDIETGGHIRIGIQM